MRYFLPLVIALCVGAGAADKPGGWGPVESLVGEWSGAGGGGPGHGNRRSRS